MKINKNQAKCNIDLKEIAKLKKELKGSLKIGNLEEKSETFKALTDPNRLQILYLLNIRDLYVCEIMEVLEKPQSTISHHLNVLRKAGFIEKEKQGVWTLYKLKNSGIIHYLDSLCKKD